MKVNTKIPIVFEVVENYDSRFQKVKIWLMHLGENYNNSFFSEEVVIENLHTIRNTPILGFIEEGKLGKDFKGHEEVLVVKDGEVTTKYLGSAYGVIPESCNPRFEEKVGDDNVVRKYLVVDGLMWTKFDDSIEILNENESVSQSMELNDEFDGYWNEDKLFHFTKFKFEGACMLGKNVSPAMQRASVEKSFSVDFIGNQVREKIEEFNNYISNNFSEEVKNLTLEELLAKYSLTAEDLANKGISEKDFSIEDLEEKIKSEFEANENENLEGEEKQVDKPETVVDEPEADDNETVADDNVDEPDSLELGVDEPSPEFQKSVMEKFKKRFELSHSDIRWKIYDKLDSHMIQNSIGNENSWFYVDSVFETYLIVDNENGQFYRINYAIESDDVALGNIVEVFSSFLTSDEKGALALMRANLESYEKENSELKEFKKKIEFEAHSKKAEELFNQFGALEEEDLIELRAKISDYSLDELEAKTFEVLGRKMAKSKFAKKKQEPTSISIKFENIDKDKGFTSVDKFFTKHGVNPNQ